MRRDTKPCDLCRGYGKVFGGYNPDGSPRLGILRCNRCQGVGFVPVVGDRVISWDSAFMLLDAEKRKNASPDAKPHSQADLL